MVVLIDSGSTHNLIDSRTARKAGVAIHKKGTFDVMVANGEKLVSGGCCKEVSISIQGIHISTKCYLLDLESWQVVLGAHGFVLLGLFFGIFQIYGCSSPWEKFLAMPFVLTNASATFQSLMNEIFRPFLRKFVLIFFYDILIHSPSKDEHLLHLQKTLDVLRKHKLDAKNLNVVLGRIEWNIWATGFPNRA